MPAIGSRFAPKGKIWVCGICGKWAYDRYGIVEPHSRMWDTSCAIHAVLVDERTVPGAQRNEPPEAA